MDTLESGLIKLGSNALEEILCKAGTLGLWSARTPDEADPWAIEFPSLATLPRFDGDATRLRICIATEDIVGPVRNGGIGTTYSALAELLAGLGHDVTILYLKGHEVENGTIEEWIDYYAAKSVRFVPVPNYAVIDRFQAGANRWLQAPYNMLKYLADHPMDVVHVSEWRGSGYLCLLAKRQNLAFRNTLFIVKTSSPWIWNRLYGSQPIDRIDDLAKVHAERLSVEYADMVIGGSLHLLRWMASQGYRIPREHTFVQPNVATFEHLADLLRQRAWEPGKRYPIDEIVFFGRLEARKGLLLFVQAIKRLLRQGKELPRQITFMGKPGNRLSARPDQEIVDYIKSESANWPTKVEILTEFQQYEALKYLLGGNRLAVMPSMIENSSLAVYEAAICGIPFIASTSGGTPELVAPADRAVVLCEAHPIPLAAHIAVALEQGGYVARPSFDNEVNLEQWRRFHLDLGRGLLEELLKRDHREQAAASRVSICIYHADTDEKLRATLLSVKDQDFAAEEVLIAVDTDVAEGVERAQATALEVGVNARVVPTFDFDAGHSFNTLADQACGEFVLFLWAGSTIRSMALRALTQVAGSTKADLLNYFFRVTHGDEDSSRLSAIVFGNVAQSFFRADVTALPLMVRRQTFADLGGFTPDYRVLAHDHEFVAKALVSGVHCETALLELGTVPAWDEQWLRTRCYDQDIAQFRAIRPKLAAAPLALRELLLMAKGLQKSAGYRPKIAKSLVSRAGVDKRRPLRSALMAFPLGLGATIDSQHEKRGRIYKAQRPAFIEAAPPRLATEGSAPPIESRAVARDLRRDQRNAREASRRGAGLVQLIDDLSAENEASAAPSQPRILVRARVSDPRPPIREGSMPQVVALHWQSSITEKRFSGRVLGVYRGVAYGWVRDEEQPDRPVEIEVINGRRSSQLLRADIDLPTVQPLPPEFKKHGFAAPLWSGWHGLHRFRSAKRLVVRIKGTDIVVGRVAAVPNANDLESSGLDGYCDVFEGKVGGWVWRPEKPEVSVDVSIFVDRKFLARTSAAQYREDLRAADVGSGAYGFAVPLPPKLLDGVARRVDVVVADTGAFLKRGRLRLVGGKLAPLAKA
ncbi:MAG: glycosyltransferase [Enhydrobacter sp.]|nr:glycosyltransferase [Enhydrobacter sp.]